MVDSIESIKGKNILLICPDFPIPPKRKVHHDFLPIGLLKIGTYLKENNYCDVRLVFGLRSFDFQADYVLITSLFTYWSECVHEAVFYYRNQYPKSKIIVGGIYATLQPEKLKEITDIEPFIGVCKPAEEYCRENSVDYNLLSEKVDFQIIHGMRGCFRKCGFCGTWKLEPSEEYYEYKPDLIKSNHVIYYDNNMLRHPDIKNILKKLNEVRWMGKVVTFESQSGFDGRILDEEIASLLKKARFINPRIAWDGHLDDWLSIEKQINMLMHAGYKTKEINVFMLYNWDYSFEETEYKRLKCWQKGVQIMDCRFRPLNQLHDNFNARLKQSGNDYHIHTGWSDEEVKQFRRNVRRHNICIRHGFSFYSKKLELMSVPKEFYLSIKGKSKNEILGVLPDAWFPAEFSPPNGKK